MLPRWVRSSLLLAVAAVLVRSASADVLYQTGFEAPDFAPGPLAGQAGWNNFGLAAGSETAATVQSEIVASGSQALLIEAARATESVYYWPPIDYNTEAYSFKQVAVQWHMLLASGGTPSPAWGVTAADESAVYVGGLLVDGATGQVFVESQDNNFEDGDPSDNWTGFFVAKDTWNHFSLLFDYNTRTFDAWVNGQQVRSGFAFAEATGSTFGDADLTLGKLPSDQSTDRAYFDNYRVAAVPEPGTLALLILAVPGMVLAGQRRRCGGGGTRH
jgi:hypothetical protein